MPSERQKIKIYVADYETTEFKFESHENYKMYKRFVCFLNVNDYDDKLYFNLENKENIEKYKQFLLSFNTKKPVRIYFHNLNFDLAFLLNDLPKGVNKQIIKANSRILAFRLYRQYKKTNKKTGKIKYYKTIFMDVRNSLSLFNTSLKQLGKSIGLEKLEQDYQDNITPEYIDYCYRDCKIVAEAINQLVQDTNELYPTFELELKKLPLTISSLNKKIFNHLGYKQFSEKVFANLVYNKSVEYLEQYLRPFYTGGRVEVFNFNKCVNGAYNDINSLYPSVMVENTFPVGKITRIKCMENECWLEWKHNPLIFGCECIVSEINDIPLLPTKLKNGKLIFGKGKKLVFLFKKEYEQLVKYGGKIEKIIALYQCEKQIDLFSNYINPLYEVKKNSKGFTKELAKLRMNGLYGKFGEKREKESVEIVENLMEIEPNDLEYIEPIEYLGKTIYLKRRELIADYVHNNVLIAMKITAMARLKIHEYLMSIVKHDKQDLYYCDTDSCVSKIEMENYGAELGEMKKEFTFEQFQALGCKEYCYIHDNQVVYKMKGFGKRETYESIQEFIDNYLLGHYQHRQTGFLESFNRNFEMNQILCYEKFKRFMYDKRVILDDLTTRAFDLDNDDYDTILRQNTKIIYDNIIFKNRNI